MDLPIFILVIDGALNTLFEKSILLGIQAVANVALAWVLYGMWKYYTNELKQIEARQQANLKESRRDLLEQNDKMYESNKSYLETLKDVLHILDNIDLNSKESKTQIITKIEDSIRTIHDKLNHLIK